MHILLRTAPADYEAVGREIMFERGQTSVTFELEIVDDDIVEGTEEFFFQFQQPDLSLLTNFDFGSIRIVDNDSKKDSTRWILIQSIFIFKTQFQMSSLTLSRSSTLLEKKKPLST